MAWYYLYQMRPVCCINHEWRAETFRTREDAMADMRHHLYEQRREPDPEQRAKYGNVIGPFECGGARPTAKETTEAVETMRVVYDTAHEPVVERLRKAAEEK
jgi:hypothetical protein